MKTLNLLLPVALATSIALPVFAQEAPKNLIANGNFETWRTATENEKTGKNAPKLVDDLIADGFWFNAEATERAKDPAFPLSTTIAQDKTIKHGGEISTLIENGATTDIGKIVLRPINVEPNTKYMIKVWVKGENIVLEKASSGPIIWTSFGPTKNFWENRKVDSTPLKKAGSFDWMQVEIPFTTAADTGQMNLQLQLRRASGKLWFDDLEIIAGEKVAAAPEL